MHDNMSSNKRCSEAGASPAWKKLDVSLERDSSEKDMFDQDEEDISQLSLTPVIVSQEDLIKSEQGLSQLSITTQPSSSQNPVYVDVDLPFGGEMSPIIVDSTSVGSPMWSGNLILSVDSNSDEAVVNVTPELSDESDSDVSFSYSKDLITEGFEFSDVFIDNDLCVSKEAEVSKLDNALSEAMHSLGVDYVANIISKKDKLRQSISTCLYQKAHDEFKQSLKT